MNYLSVEQLTKTFGEKRIFCDLTFGVDQGQKVAIVAKNGAGKTTLLKCLMGMDSVDNGRIVFRNDIRVAFMEQTDLMNENQTVLDAIFDQDLPSFQLVKAYNDALLASDEKSIEQLYEKISSHNAWDLEVKVKQLLSVFKLDNLQQKISALSGGQRKRVALAKVLLSEAEFLLLDEPTNHLDLDMIEWLEQYLATSKSTLLMVTHDRYFLEVVCDTIFELSDETLFKYKGNFSYYLEKKAERE
ncbi:MAG: ABC-F family ATP-binding cassette domain-containing protein, partial [Bacteroidetes bacterium]|nr:ABC-F family ATP-binding cassette domain-containing protein [Bacteroidota bacterium]